MTEAYISTRCKKILYMIMASDTYVSLPQISEEFKLSKRSIYYELCKINDWLSVQGINEITVVRGKGIKLTEEEKQQIEQVMEKGGAKEEYIFSPMERIYFIICYIIKSKEAVNVEQLAEYLQVSRNTIFNDIRVVVKQLQDFDLTLGYKSKQGYFIDGDSIRIRALFMLYINMLKPVYESETFSYLKDNSVEENLKKLQKIETKLNTSYVEGTLRSIAMLIPLMEKGNEELYFPDLNKEELENSQEYRLIEEEFPNLIEKEKIYLCLHLLGSRVSMNTMDVFNNYSKESNYELSKALVAEFEKVACVKFEDKDDLEKALYYHLNTSMYRFQYGIQVGNPMLEDVVREYSELFDLTKIVCHYLEQQIGLPVPEGEVAYLTLHFGAHLQKEEEQNEKIRVLIVCTNGISSGNMIKHELLKMLPQVDIVGVVSNKEAINVHNICDVVISTHKINCLVPVIVVHPILTDFDKKLILNHSVFKNLQGNVDVDELFQTIKKFVDNDKRDDLYNELQKYFESRNQRMTVYLDKKKKGLLDLLSKDLVFVENKKCRWEEALRKSAKPLEERGTINEQYIESIIDSLRYYGPYMFITKDVVLAHSQPKDNVNDLGVSIGVFKEPVQFSNFHEAKIIIVMSAEDQEKHLRVLKDIMGVFSVEKNVEKLEMAENPDEILDSLKLLIK